MGRRPAARAELRHDVRLSPQAAARLARLEADVPPTIFQRVVELLRDADEAGFTRGTLEAEAHWQRFLAHWPGCAPALDVVWQHAWRNEERAGCQVLAGQCQLGPPIPPA